MPSTIIRTVATGFASVLALSAGAQGQQSTAPTPAQLERATERLEAWRKGRIHVYMDDFGELRRYRAANAKLGPPSAKEKRVWPRRSNGSAYAFHTRGSLISPHQAAKPYPKRP